MRGLFCEVVLLVSIRGARIQADGNFVERRLLIRRLIKLHTELRMRLRERVLETVGVHVSDLHTRFPGVNLKLV